jgi:hypothetical protein
MKIATNTGFERVSNRCGASIAREKADLQNA